MFYNQGGFYYSCLFFKPDYTLLKKQKEGIFMKKKTVIVLMLIVALIVSCASNHGVALSQNKNVVGKNGIKRPDWVIHDSSNKKTLFTTGYGTGRTFETAKMKADLNADSEIALWVSSSVDTVRERFITESVDIMDASQSELYMDHFTSASAEVGKAILSGVDEVDFWEDADGGVWVLHSIPKANIQAQLQSVIESVFEDIEGSSSFGMASQAADSMTAILEEVMSIEE